MEIQSLGPAAAGDNMESRALTTFEVKVFKSLDEGLGCFLSAEEKVGHVAKVREWEAGKRNVIQVDKEAFEMDLDWRIEQNIVEAKDRNTYLVPSAEKFKRKLIAEEKLLKLITPHAQASCRHLCEAVIENLPAELRHYIHSLIVPKQQVELKDLIKNSAEIKKSMAHYADLEYSVDYLGEDFARELTEYCYSSMTFVFPEFFNAMVDVKPWLEGIDRHGLRRIDCVRRVRFTLPPKRYQDLPETFFLASGIQGTLLKMKPSVRISFELPEAMDSEDDVATDSEDDMESDSEDDMESDSEDDMESDSEDDTESDSEDDMESDTDDSLIRMIGEISEIQKEVDTLKAAGHKIRMGGTTSNVTLDAMELTSKGWKEITPPVTIAQSDRFDVGGMGRLMADV